MNRIKTPALKLILLLLIQTPNPTISLLLKTRIPLTRKRIETPHLLRTLKSTPSHLDLNSSNIAELAQQHIRDIVDRIDLNSHIINQNPKPRFLEQRNLRNVLTMGCPNEPVGLNNIMTISLIVLFIYLMFNTTDGALAIFGIPLFLALFGKLFIFNRRLTKVDPKCRLLRKLAKKPNGTFFNKTKLSLARFLKKHHYDTRRKLSQNELFDMAKQYFVENKALKGKDWLRNLKMITQIVFKKQNIINQVLGLISR